MKSLLNRILILSLSRVLNYVILFFSPVLLVRLLSINEYGKYRQFILYSMIIALFLEFSVKQNLNYFVANDPENEKDYINNTIIINLLMSLLGCFSIIIFQKTFFTDFTFVNELMIYVFVIVNLNFIENYWIVKQKTNLVLFYSFAFALLKICVLVIVAYVTRDVKATIISLIVIEALKKIYNAGYLIREKLIVLKKINKEIIKAQLIYIVPLGISSYILYLNNNISQVIITSTLGVTALAIYSIGSQQVPILNILRSSINDVIFPDIVVKNKSNILDGLYLWKKSTSFYFFVSVPVFFICFYSAKEIIQIFFTKVYLDSVPIFQIYLFLLLRQSFEMGTPLRSINKNSIFVYAFLLSFLINLSLIYTFYCLLGFWGPAIANVLTEFLLIVFMGIQIIKLYKIKIRDLFEWNDILNISISGIISTPLLFVGGLINNIYLKVVFAGILYFSGYIFLCDKLKIMYPQYFFKKVQGLYSK